MADRLFTDSLGRPVTLMNDADAAGVAEVRFGAGKDKPGVVVLGVTRFVAGVTSATAEARPAVVPARRGEVNSSVNA